MGAKRALIVDDSKSARMFLSRILERYEIEVDSAENAEAAIEYLGTHRPDVIFMDHMMPGMDGFQAVQAIKNNPRTATIPIMMYTSQEGELYLGQARALGAVGVLPKQIKPADVSKVLYQLHLVPDRRSGEQTSFKPVTLTSVESTPEGEEAAAAAAPKPLTESALREQFAELRRVLVTSIDTQSDRITADVRAILRDAMQQLPENPPIIQPSRPWPWVVASLALIAAIGALGLWWREMELRREAMTQIAQLHQEAEQAAAAAEAAQAAAAAAEVRNAAPGTVAPGEGAAPAPEEAGLPEVAVVPYGSDPLAGPRLELIRQYVADLMSQDFHGIVEVRTYPGRFCLIGNPTEGFSVAPDDAPFARCDVVGNPYEESQQSTQRESLGFANLAGEVRSASGGAINLILVPGDAASVAVSYPQVTANLLAGEWNRAASANNRIELRLR